MFLKLVIGSNLLSIFFFWIIYYKYPLLPSFITIFKAMAGPYINLFSFIATFIISIFAYPYIIGSFIFIKTGKFLYIDVEDVLQRYSLYLKTVVGHLSLMSFVYSLMTLITTFSNGTIKHSFSVDVTFSIGTFQLLACVFSTALKIPFLAHATEFYIIYDSGSHVETAILESIYTLVFSLFTLVCSFVLETYMESNFISYFSKTYNNYTPNIDTFVDAAYSSVMFTCMYFSVLNYYRIW
ncbi:hypothetical protein NUSPORA_00064 [Nucleospora cyclopteri]